MSARYWYSSYKTAMDHAFTGVMARGSGIPYDCALFITTKIIIVCL